MRSSLVDVSNLSNWNHRFVDLCYHLDSILSIFVSISIYGLEKIKYMKVTNSTYDTMVAIEIDSVVSLCL